MKQRERERGKLRGPGRGKKERRREEEGSRTRKTLNPRGRCKLTDLFTALESLLVLRSVLKGVKRSAIGRAQRNALSLSLSSSFSRLLRSIYGLPRVATFCGAPEELRVPERSFLCVAIKGSLKRRFQAAADPPPVVRSVQLGAAREGASPRANCIRYRQTRFAAAHRLVPSLSPSPLRRAIDVV